MKVNPNVDYATVNQPPTHNDAQAAAMTVAAYCASEVARLLPEFNQARQNAAGDWREVNGYRSAIRNQLAIIAKLMQI